MWINELIAAGGNRFDKVGNKRLGILEGKDNGG